MRSYLVRLLDPRTRAVLFSEVIPAPDRRCAEFWGLGYRRFVGVFHAIVTAELA